MPRKHKIIARVSPVPGYLTLEDVANQFDRCHSAVFKWVGHGYFPGIIRINRQYFVPESALAEFKPPPLGNPRRCRGPKREAWELFLKNLRKTQRIQDAKKSRLTAGTA